MPTTLSSGAPSLSSQVTSGTETPTAPSLLVKRRTVFARYVARSYSRSYISPLKKARRDLAFYRTVYRVSLKRLHPTMREQFEELETALGEERRDWQKRVKCERNNTVKALQLFDRLSAHCNATHDAWQEDRKFWKAKTKSLQRDIRILELTNQSCQNVFSELENILHERIAASASGIE
ncbi:hypothetical protein C8R41DRAFT_924212 [Lentinula lateritia]|uniref:Uncharacterized protein n=1 Tax=Lentinula lateritia TaxID=40482 RepID=A0ABQ8V9U3_9AGAR|nr:hypothetical protein C8R41DRAFT_924212 [Lentinula lateritia]